MTSGTSAKSETAIRTPATPSLDGNAVKTGTGREWIGVPPEGTLPPFAMPPRHAGLSASQTVAARAAQPQSADAETVPPQWSQPGLGGGITDDHARPLPSEAAWEWKPTKTAIPGVDGGDPFSSNGVRDSSSANGPMITLAAKTTAAAETLPAVSSSTTPHVRIGTFDEQGAPTVDVGQEGRSVPQTSESPPGVGRSSRPSTPASAPVISRDSVLVEALATNRSSPTVPPDASSPTVSSVPFQTASVARPMGVATTTDLTPSAYLGAPINANRGRDGLPTGNPESAVMALSPRRPPAMLSESPSDRVTSIGSTGTERTDDSAGPRTSPTYHTQQVTAATPASPQAVPSRTTPATPPEASTDGPRAAPQPVSSEPAPVPPFRADTAAGRGHALRIARSQGRTTTSEASVDDQANTEDTQGGNTTVQPSAGTQTPKPLDAALFGTPTTQGSVSAYHPVADVKVVTDVNPPPSPGVTPSDGTARIREAMASVANQAVIRGASTGTVDVPELGRVAVHARSEAGAIDVSVTVAHSAAQQVLQAHAAGIVGDLRHAALPISRMSVEQSSTSGSAFGSTTSQGDRQAFSNQTPQRERPATVLAEEQPLPIATMPGRVRIVL